MAPADARGSPAEDTDDPSDSEQEFTEAFHRLVDEGQRRLGRRWPALLSTGLVGGFDVGVGVLAYLVVLHATGDAVLASLGFTVGFVALALGGSELFTEDFLVPIVTTVARPEVGVGRVVRLWAGTLVANVVAGWILMAIVVAALPDVRPVLVDVGAHFPDLGTGREVFASAVLAGMTMTLLTWLEHQEPAPGSRIAAAVAAGFVLAAAPLAHAVVRAMEMSGALVAGAPFGYAEALGIFGWTALGNLVGGVGLVTVLRLVQIGAPVVASEQRRPARGRAPRRPGQDDED